MTQPQPECIHCGGPWPSADEGLREDNDRLMRCIDMAMGCIDPESKNPDERLAWLRLLDAKNGKEPRDHLMPLGSLSSQPTK